MSRGLILLTGGSGFIGFAVLVKALQQGFRVRAVARSESKAETITSATSVKPYLDSLSFVVVPDFLAEGAFDEPLNGAEYVIHVAAGLPALEMDFKDPEQVNECLVKPNYQVLGSFLHAAKSHPSIKRIVITSSAGAMVSQLWDTADPEKPTVLPMETFSADTPPPKRSLAGPFSCVNDAYHVAKARALQQTFDFIASERPPFSIVNVMPTFTLGKNELA